MSAESTPRPMSRRKFLRLTAGGIAGVGAVGIGGSAYVTRIEPYIVTVTRVTLPVRRLPPAFEGFTIAQVSDWHFGEWMTLDHMLGIAEQVNALEPDLVAMTGDFVSVIYRDTPQAITTALNAFHAPAGVAAVLGNHDHWTDAPTIRAAVEAADGVRLLNNRALPLQRHGQILYIAGVDDIWEAQHDLAAALHTVPIDAATILLAHEPDYADEAAATGRIGLQLSGHSHGGQVRLPLKGALILPHLGQKYDQGHYTVNDMHLYVNRGIGMIAPYVRLNCTPEITLITLTASL
jgi:predicted MPP superfamily phosphohydrolase